MQPQPKPRVMTDARRQASRINGAKSRGPKTAAGKARSSRNACTHGLFARKLDLGPADSEAIRNSRDAHFRRFQPADPYELALVESMVLSWWAIRRAWDYERQAFDSAIACGAAQGGRSLVPGHDLCHALDIASRCETTAARSYDRARRALSDHRAVFAQLPPMPNEHARIPPAPQHMNTRNEPETPPSAAQHPKMRNEPETLASAVSQQNAPPQPTRPPA